MANGSVLLRVSSMNTLDIKALRRLREKGPLGIELGERRRERVESTKATTKKLTIGTLVLPTTGLLTLGWCLVVLTEPKKRTPGEGGVVGIGVAGDYE